MMKSILNFILILSLIIHIVNGQFKPFIIGGDIAPIAIAPYFVSLRTSGGSPICGGAIIDNRWIITAAHCLSDENPVFVVVGTNQLKSGGTRYDVLKKIQHIWYNPTNLNYDVGLIKTKTEITYTDLVRPIQLPSRNVVANETLILTGHGRTNITSGPSPDLKIAYLKSISNEECRARNPASTFLYRSTLCTLTGSGGCFGDSGSPLIKDGVIHGIMSFTNTLCDKRYPEGYVRVYHFNIWIYLIRIFNMFD